MPSKIVGDSVFYGQFSLNIEKYLSLKNKLENISKMSLALSSFNLGRRKAKTQWIRLTLRLFSWQILVTFFFFSKTCVFTEYFINTFI